MPCVRVPIWLILYEARIINSAGPEISSVASFNRVEPQDVDRKAPSVSQTRQDYVSLSRVANFTVLGRGGLAGWTDSDIAAGFCGIGKSTELYRSYASLCR